MDHHSLGNLFADAQHGVQAGHRFLEHHGDAIAADPAHRGLVEPDQVTPAEMHGAERGREQVAANMSIVFAILLPAGVGLWLTLPSLEQLVVPQDFRGPFGHYLELLLIGMFCFGLMNYAINPIFQIRKATRPLIVCAIIACVTDALLIHFLPSTPDASHYAIAQAGAFTVALVALLTFAALTGPKWPSARDILLSMLGTAVMAAVVLQMRGWTPGVITVAAQAVVGAVIYVGFVIAFDIARLRTHALEILAARKPQPA